jgi:hypothetical protein
MSHLSISGTFEMLSDGVGVVMVMVMVMLMVAVMVCSHKLSILRCFCPFVHQ